MQKPLVMLAKVAGGAVLCSTFTVPCMIMLPVLGFMSVYLSTRMRHAIPLVAFAASVVGLLMFSLADAALRVPLTLLGLSAAMSWIVSGCPLAEMLVNMTYAVDEEGKVIEVEVLDPED